MSEPSPAAPVTLWSPLAYPDFRRLWSGFIVSHVGDSIQLLAQSWIVVELTHSALRVGAVALSQALPRLFISAFAGVLIDRVDRRRVLLVSQSLAMAQSVLFLAMLLAHQVTYHRVLVLAFALGVFDSLNLTARQAMMPSLVPPKLIARAVALQALGVNVTQLLGPSLGGALLLKFGPVGCVSVNALSFLALLVQVARIRTHSRPDRTPSNNLGDDLREGFAFMRQRADIGVPIALAWALGLLGMPLVRQLPLFSRVVLRTDESTYGLLAAASGVGALLASVLVTARAEPTELPRNIVLAGVLFSASLGAFSQVTSVPSAFAVLVLFGAAQMAFRSAVSTILQTRTPDRLRGRVISILAMDFSLWSLGAAILGSLADVLGARYDGLHGLHGPPSPAAVGYGLQTAIGLAAIVTGVVVALGARALLRAPPPDGSAG